jgi:hypothetical protein
MNEHQGIRLEGAIDYALGVPVERNPYNPEDSDWSKAHSAWTFGWEEAASIYPPTWLERRRAWAQKLA